MNRWLDRRRTAAMGAMLFFGAQVACATPESPGGEEPAADERIEAPASDPGEHDHGAQSHQGCGGFQVERVLTLEWVEGRDDTLARSASTAKISLTSTASVPITADLVLRVRADGRLVDKPLGQFQVGPRSTSVVTVDVRVPGVRAADLELSGQMVVDATMLVDGERIAGSSSTDALFFHGEGDDDRLVLYGEDVHREQLNAGDFRGRLAPTVNGVKIAGRGVARLATPEDLHGDPMDGR